jgi:hypothetical protein
MELYYVLISEQVADNLTKLLYRDKFQVFRIIIGVKNIERVSHVMMIM